VSLVVDQADEAETTAMRAVAQAVGAEHVMAPLRWSEVERWLPRAFAAMDQPSYDGLNTYAVARAAAEHGLKVALSGLGADELFGGYGYARRVALLERARRLPAATRRVAATAAWLLPGRQGEKARAWLAGHLPAGSAHELLRRLFLPHEVERLRRRAGPGSEASGTGRATTPPAPPVPSSSPLDLTGYTRDVLLRDTDCMGMAHGLEVRVPYLDQALAAFVLRLPAAQREAPGKRLLVDAVRDLLPPAVLARRKRGFVLPVDRWLRGPMRREVEATFSAPPPAVGELLAQEEILRLWRRFLAGGASWHGVWALYALCRWAAEGR
jgi:asparagine synthase (glutamine-hydrolysing)